MVIRLGIFRNIRCLGLRQSRFATIAFCDKWISCRWAIYFFGFILKWNRFLKLSTTWLSCGQAWRSQNRLKTMDEQINLAQTLRSDLNCRECGRVQTVFLMLLAKDYGFSCKHCPHFNDLHRTVATRIVELVKISKQISPKANILEIDATEK